MTQELNLPLTTDGEGYDKQAVIDYISHLENNQDTAPRIIQQAEQLLNDAQEKADSISKDAEERVAGIDKDLKDLKESKLKEIEVNTHKLISDAETQSRKTLDAANRRATNIVEEALSKVHSLVKNAQGKLESAKKKSAELDSESSRRYSDAVSMAGVLIKNAEAHADGEMQKGHEEASQLRIEGETMIVYAHQEAKIIMAEANEKSTNIMDEAENYRDQVVSQAHEEVRKAKEVIDHYKAFYQDSVSRLSSLYSARYEESQALVAVVFPDGENLQGLNPAVDVPVSHTHVEDTANDNTSLDLSSIGLGSDDDDLEEFNLTNEQATEFEELSNVLDGLDQIDDDDDDDKTVIDLGNLDDNDNDKDKTGIDLDDVIDLDDAVDLDDADDDSIDLEDFDEVKGSK